MKTINKILSCCMLLFIFVSCQDDKQEYINDLKDGQIVLKIVPDKYNTYKLYLEVDEVTIDWGDSIKEEYVSDKEMLELTHAYNDKSERTIVVDTKKMTAATFPGLIMYHAEVVTSAECRELSFGECRYLESLHVRNGYLTKLDIRKCPVLKSLNCQGNPLQELDISRNTKLESLNCSSNDLTSLDISRNLKLISLQCIDNQLLKLDVSNHSNLQSVVCGYNLLSELNLSASTQLSSVDCSDNRLTQIKVNSDNLWMMDVRNNLLSGEVLDALFHKLPDNDTGGEYFVEIAGNPGATTCDQAIAENKGWDVIK